MKELFEGISLRAARRVLGGALLMLVAATFFVSALLWPVSGGAQQACNVNFTLSSTVTTDLPSVDCDTAKAKAYQKALQDVKNQRAAYVCPAACPTLVEVTPPHITCGPECTPFQINGVTRYDGAADAEGTYKCVP